MSQIPNDKGAKITIKGEKYTLHRPGSPVPEIEGRENLAIWKNDDGDCFMLSLEQDQMIYLPDCGDESQ